MVGILPQRLASGHGPVRDVRFELKRSSLNDRRVAVRRPDAVDQQPRGADRPHGRPDGDLADEVPWSQTAPAPESRGVPQAIAVLPARSRRAAPGEIVGEPVQGRDYDLVLLDLQSAEQLNLSVIRDLQLLGDETVVVIVNNGGGDGSLLQRVLAGNLGMAEAGEDMPVPPSSVIERGFLRIDPRSNQVTWKDEMVPLTIAEFNIVRLFGTRIGDAICYRDIYDVVHGTGFHAGDGENGYHTNVRSLVKRIRKKFLGIDPDFAEIENHRAFGYRWRTEPRQPAARRSLRGN